MAESYDTPLKGSQWLIAAWGVLGACYVLSQALVRIVPLAWEPIANGMLSWWQWALYLAFCIFNAYAEGYRGFQNRYCPRVVSRALYLAKNPRPLFVLFAPLFCMGLFHAKRRNLIISWALVVLISCVVFAVRRLDQPWRGIIDGGVVVGLGWGLVALVVRFIQAAWFAKNIPPLDSLPDDAPATSPAS